MYVLCKFNFTRKNWEGITNIIYLSTFILFSYNKGPLQKLCQIQPRWTMKIMSHYLPLESERRTPDRPDKCIIKDLSKMIGKSEISIVKECLSPNSQVRKLLSHWLPNVLESVSRKLKYKKMSFFNFLNFCVHNS